jgi:DNA polymerase delta subunit 1
VSYVSDTEPAPIPKMLTELDQHRTAVKRSMKQATGTTKDVLDQKQLAIKLTMNSTYGYVGSTMCAINRPQIAATVTAFGRELIKGTDLYTKQQYPGAMTVAGDTDSVYVKLPGDRTTEQLFVEGSKIVKGVNEMYGFPIVLELEKVYSPLLILKKKRYAGMAFLEPGGLGKLDVKGIEMNRKDSSTLTKTLQRSVINEIMARPTACWDAIEQLVKNAIQDVRTDHTILIKTKPNTAKIYKHPESNIGYCVAQKMIARKQEVEARIPFLVEVGKGAIFTRVEHPLYAKDIHYDYYINALIRQLLSNILEIVAPDQWKRLFN